MRFVEPAIRGKGFYPGCSGFDGDPTGSIMLLGRDFGTRTYFEGLAGPPVRDETALTWRHTRDIWLKELCDISAWCTNYLMGLREDGSAKGNIKLRIAATDWNLFESSCWDFLQEQVLLQKPRVIVVFGTDNQLDLMAKGRFGTNSSRSFPHAFEAWDTSHSALVTFADHPHSLIRETAKHAARIEVKRIINLYHGASV
jgi:hypothetical protein